VSDLDLADAETDLDPLITVDFLAFAALPADSSTEKLKLEVGVPSEASTMFPFLHNFQSEGTRKNTRCTRQHPSTPPTPSLAS